MTETPSYSVIRKEKEFELREYPAYIKAEVDVTETSFKRAIYKGFNFLAGYIFGNNIKTEKIAMTTPVQVSESQKIAMTTPVTISGDGSYTMAFIMPAEYSLETLPVPKDSAIRLTSVPKHRMAVIRFNGFFPEARIRKGKQQLREWVEKEGLKTEGDFIVAGYNPPWVPGFLARNEVMIMVKSGDA